MKHSKLYIGRITHKRLEPFIHRFEYGVFMAYVDLDETQKLVGRQSWLYSSKRRALVEFRRSDYHGDPNLPLADCIRKLVQNKTGNTTTGPIRMLTNLRVLGYIINPVTFYYCFNEQDTQVEHIVVEITNTPWNERHAYVLTPEKNLSDKADWYHYIIDKDFHVSPFLELDYEYEMQFSQPKRNLVVSIANNRANERKFIATLKLHEEALTLGNLLKQLICKSAK